MNNRQRIKKIRTLLVCDTDVELAKKLGTNQPQISRWRNVGFHGAATSALVDALLGIISKLMAEVKNLKKELSHKNRGVRDEKS